MVSEGNGKNSSIRLTIKQKKADSHKAYSRKERKMDNLAKHVQAIMQVAIVAIKVAIMPVREAESLFNNARPVIQHQYQLFQCPDSQQLTGKLQISTMNYAI